MVLVTLRSLAITRRRLVSWDLTAGQEEKATEADLWRVDKEFCVLQSSPLVICRGDGWTSGSSDSSPTLLDALRYVLVFGGLDSDWFKDWSELVSLVTQLQRFIRKSLMDGLDVLRVPCSD